MRKKRLGCVPLFLLFLAGICVVSIIGGKLSAYNYSFTSAILIDGNETIVTRRFSSKYLKENDNLLTFELTNRTPYDLHLFFVFDDSIDYIKVENTDLKSYGKTELFVKIREANDMISSKTKYFNLLKTSFIIKSDINPIDCKIILKESNF